MPLLDRCLCWKDVRTGSVATAVFSMTTSFAEILLQVALWAGNENADQLVTNVEYVMYIPLACLDLLLIIMGALVLVALEKERYGRPVLLTWISLALLCIFYEAAINVYFFYITFSTMDAPSGLMRMAREPWGSDIIAELIVLFIYWAIKLFIYLLGIACMVSTYQERSTASHEAKESLALGGYFNETRPKIANYPRPQLGRIAYH